MRTEQADIRTLEPGAESVDLITAAAVLHHLRGEEEWYAVFRKFHRALRPGGSLWIADLIRHDLPGVERMMQRRYGEYLAGLKGPAYRDEVFAYIEKEDTPRSLGFQVEALRAAGFIGVEILHKKRLHGSVRRGEGPRLSATLQTLCGGANGCIVRA